MIVAGTIGYSILQKPDEEHLTTSHPPPDIKKQIKSTKKSSSTQKTGIYSKYSEAEVWSDFENERQVIEGICKKNKLNPVPVMIYSKRFGIYPFLALANVKAESGFKRDAISPAGAKGILQLMGPTAKEFWAKYGYEISELDLNKPDHCLRVGISYMSWLSQDVSWIRDIQNERDRWKVMLAAWNWGPGHVGRNGGRKGFKDLEPNLPQETRNHVNKVLRTYDEYQKQVASV